MDKKGIDKGILSYTTPGVFFKNEEWSRNFARRCNEYLAEVKQQNQNRFGGWACLPLPDVEGALIELEYAMNTLKLDGVGLLSNVNGVYPGDESYRELFEELNKRNSVVFIHPSDPPTKLTVSVNNGFYGWYVETSKAAMGLAKSGYINDFPNVRYILAHGGGVYPAFAHMLRELKEPMLNGHFYVDTAKAVHSDNLDRLFSTMEASQVLFGSDYPMAGASKITYWHQKLGEYFDGREQELIDIYRNHIKAIFPDIQAN